MTSDLDYKTYSLLFAVRRSVRYHDRRRRFYEIWNTFTEAGIGIGGSSAIATFIAGSTVFHLVFSAAVAVVAVSAAFGRAVGGIARRADRHGDLARQFIALEQEFAHGRNLENDECEALTRRRLAIEASEPPVLRLLDAMCHFEVLRSLGDATRHPRVPWVRRAASQWLSQTNYALSLGESADGAA